MNLSPNARSPQRRADSLPGKERAAVVTLFAIPKSFDDPAIALIQRNAIRSWLRLAPQVNVLLMGDEPGLGEFAATQGVRHVTGLRRSAWGTPLLSDAFALARDLSETPILVYCNSDVILREDLLTAVDWIRNDGRFPSFVAFGRRRDIQIERAVDCDCAEDVAEIQRIAQQHSRAPIVCKEYFVFTRDMYSDVPDFCVGRGNWDNWMIAQARSQGVPVINVSEVVSAYHQQHGYDHARTSRWGCYVSGPEARQNQQLAGGRHVIRGCVATWNLTRTGIRRNPGAWLHKDFWVDLPCFLRMLVRLPFVR